MEIAVSVKGLMIDPVTKMPIVVLRESNGARTLPIWVGVFEANAIALGIEGVSPPRPMTHDLMKRLLERLQGRVERIVVSALKENTFYAVIYVDAGLTEPVPIDARPSDAIALALRTKAPVFVEDTVLRAVQAESASRDSDLGRLREWLEGLTDEDLGKYKM